MGILTAKCFDKVDSHLNSGLSQTHLGHPSPSSEGRENITVLQRMRTKAIGEPPENITVVTG